MIANLLVNSSFDVGAGWLKSHVGFHGNEIADSFAKYASYAMAVTDTHKQPTAPHTIKFHGNPSIAKFGGAARLRYFENHDHTGIGQRISFDWSRNYSWFSSFFPQNGYWELKAYKVVAPCGICPTGSATTAVQHTPLTSFPRGLSAPKCPSSAAA